MVELIEYAIRVKGTNRYLPRPQRRDGRGGSHLEPIDFSDPSSWPKGYDKHMQIRSYRELRAARCFLASWLKGKVGCHRGMGDGWGDYDYYEENYLVQGSARDPNMMEIVPITISLPPL